MSDVLREIDRFGDWYRNAALPRWARTGWDETHGGFFESLDFAGEPIRGRRRVRVQSRQVYTFSMAAIHGWRDDAEDLAAWGFDYLLNHACPDEGERGCVHILSDEGVIIDDRRDLYDQAFLLLACASRIMAAKCERARALADKTIAFLDRELASPHGGWAESDKGETPRRQNPHMHLLEAFMALYQATGNEEWKQHAGDVIALFKNHFLDRDRGVLCEFFVEDWSAPDSSKGAFIEPGHMMEWVWLLGHYEAISGADFSAEKKTLYKNARAHADAAGFLPDSVGAPNADGARRLWPQTEYMKAAAILSSSPADDFAKDIGAVINACFETYLDQPVSGLWCDQFDASGKPVARDVPASILYHLFEAVAETESFAKGDRLS